MKAERVQSPKYLRLHAVTFASCGEMKGVEGEECITKPLNLRRKKEELS